MAKLHHFMSTKTIFSKIVGTKTFNKFHPLGRSIEKAAEVPEPPPATPMPDEEAIQRAKKRSLAAQAGRTGRASTILSDQNSDRLGP